MQIQIQKKYFEYTLMDRVFLYFRDFEMTST